MAKHRNLFRECLEAHARGRADSGLAPFTHAAWAEYFNDLRPWKEGGQRVAKISESAVSRAASNTPGVRRRMGMDRVWVISALGLDYFHYIAAWEGWRFPRERFGTGILGRGAQSHRADSGSPQVE